MAQKERSQQSAHIEGDRDSWFVVFEAYIAEICGHPQKKTIEDTFQQWKTHKI